MLLTLRKGFVNHKSCQKKTTSGKPAANPETTHIPPTAASGHKQASSPCLYALGSLLHMQTMTKCQGSKGNTCEGSLFSANKWPELSFIFFIFFPQTLTHMLQTSGVTKAFNAAS